MTNKHLQHIATLSVDDQDSVSFCAVGDTLAKYNKLHFFFEDIVLKNNTTPLNMRVSYNFGRNWRTLKNITFSKPLSIDGFKNISCIRFAPSVYNIRGKISLFGEN